MHIYRYLLLLAMLASEAVMAQNHSSWEYKGEQDGIKIYHQKTPGLLHIKLVMRVKAPLSGIAELFADADNYRVWGYKMSESRLLRRASSHELWYYAKYDFPWPMEDRDIILHSKLEQDPKSRKMTITNTPYPTYLPENKGVTRIKNSTTRWVFTPEENGWVKVEQQLSTDSAQSMPDWLVKMTADTGPRETAKAVRKTLQQTRYQVAQLAHIID